MLGYQYNNWTPYLLVSEVRSGEGIDLPRVDTTGAPFPYPLYGAIVNNVVTVLTTNRSSQISSVGVRWDFSESMALKAQFDHISKPPGSAGDVFVLADPSFGPKEQDVNVFALGLDFIY